MSGARYDARPTRARHLVAADRIHFAGSQVDPFDYTSPQLTDKLTAFGLAVREIDGHDYGQLLDALSAEPQPGKPTGIIAHTHKGHPISYMSYNVAWHHKVPNDEQYALAVAELEALEDVR